MSANYLDPQLLGDPLYAALLANLGMTEEEARADASLYGFRNTRDQSRVIPEMQRNDAIEDQNLALGYEGRGLARSSIRQNAARDLNQSQAYGLEGAQLGFQDRGVDIERGLASSLAQAQRERAAGYGDAQVRLKDEQRYNALFDNVNAQPAGTTAITSAYDAVRPPKKRPAYIGTGSGAF